MILKNLKTTFIRVRKAKDFQLENQAKAKNFKKVKIHM